MNGRGLTIWLCLGLLGCGTDPAAEVEPGDASTDSDADAPNSDAAVDAPAEDIPSDAPVTDVLTDAPHDAPDDVIPTDTPLEPDGSGEPDAPVEVGEPDVSPEFQCIARSATTSFGIELAIDLDRCVFSLSELADGVTLPYTVRIETGETPVWSRSLDAGGCDRAGESGLAILERVQGGDQSWCVCDEGLCFESPAEFAILEPGTFQDSIEWDGRNWFGPSDFGNPVGDPFPPGEYSFAVRAAGQYVDDERALEWDITVTAPILVNE